VDARFTFGTWVSAGGHLGLVVWLLAGWGMSQEPLDFEVTEVSVVSGEEYAAIVAATTPTPSPDPSTEVEALPVPPEVEAPPPVEEQVETPPPPVPEPAPEPPAEEAPPPPAPEPVPQPTEVTDVLPEPQPPQPDIPPPAPDVSLRPQPRPAQRVANEAVAPPPPEAEIAPEVQEQVTEEAEVEAEVVEEAQEATAPEETATEIVTEAEEPSGAPEVALRPMSRPSRPAAPAEEVETASADVSDDVAALLEGVAGADTSAPAPAANPGPPMTGAERDAFRLAVQGCWVVDPGAQAAGVTVTVVFQLDRQGRLTAGPDLLTSSGGTPGAVEAAYQAARRAVTRCGRDGFSLPEEKYEQWRVVEMTFDPSGMRLR
jgi:hypothetical protein